MKAPKIVPYIAVIIAMLFWGLSFVWSKQLIEANFNIIFILFTRLMISFLLLFVIFKSLGKVERIAKKDIWKFALLAFFEPFVYFIGENYSMKYVSASFAAIFIAVIPVVIPFGLKLFFKEKLRSKVVIGAIISILGIALISLNKNFSFDIDIRGLLLLALAVLAAVGYSIVFTFLSHYNAVTITIFQNVFAAIYYLPLLLVVGKEGIFDAEWNSQSIVALLMLSVFCSSIAFIGYSYAAQRISIARAALFANLIPVSTIIFAMLIGQESALSWQKILGMAIVITGVVMGSRPTKL
jgi:drug/metabolite transporter (DMT)-like permease